MRLSLIGLIAALTVAAVPAYAADDNSGCGPTTHGTNLKDKGSQVDPNDPASYYRALGPVLLHGERDGKTVDLWYDIHHESSVQAVGNGYWASRRDCGFMYAVARKGDTVQVIFQSLQPGDIDQILNKQIPSLP